MKPSGDKFVRVLMGVAAILVVGVVGVGAFLVGRNSESTSGASANPGQYDYSVLNRVRELLDRDYVKQENLDDEALFEAAVNGMLDILHDRGTYYVTPTDHQLDTTLTGSFDGIGATISQYNNEIVIVAPIKDTPAEKAGLVSGDVILAVDGESTKGWTVDKTVLRIRGPKGTQVTVDVRHEDGREESYTLTRSTVQVESVTRDPPGGALRDASGTVIDSIGYIHIREFSRRTPQELEAAIKAELDESAKALIMDVRSNPGGLLVQTQQIVDMFLDNGTMVIQRDAQGKETTVSARAGQIDNRLKDVPIVILQNKFSASASEIFAAALRDNGRAVVVGETSTGKGTVNIARDLPNGGALYVSIANWLTPTGALIDNVGVRPDFEVVPTDEDIDLRRDPQLVRAVEILRTQASAR